MTEALRGVIDEVILAFGPLVDATQDPDALRGLLADLGWTPASVPQPLSELASAGSDLSNVISAASEDVSTIQALMAVGRLVEAIDAIRTKPDAAFPAGIDVASFKATIGRDLVDYLLVDHLLRNRHPLGALLRLAGIIRLVELPAAGLRRSYLRRQVAWSAIGDLVTDPARGFREGFDWNSTTPRLTSAVEQLASLLEYCGLQLSYFQPSGDLLRFAAAGTDAPVVGELGIDLAFEDGSFAGVNFAAGLQLLVRPATADRGPGIALLPYASSSDARDVTINDHTSLSIRGDTNLTKGAAITLAPGRPPEVQAGFLGGASVTPAELEIGLRITGAPDEPDRVLIGTPDGSRLSMRTLLFSAGARLVSLDKLDAFVALELEDARVVVKPAVGEGDSFVNGLLGEAGFSAELSLGFRLSSVTGFHLTGSTDLEANVPVGVRLGPIEVQAISIGLKPSGSSVDFEVGATIAGNLGPIAIVVEGIGFRLGTRFPEPPTGNLGPLDVAFGFKPPSGIGLLINSAGVTGGGFLSRDAAKHEYAGVLQLEYAQITLQAFGLLTTQVAGGDGYSLLALVDARFPPVQLGWGFTLDGVGGLLALHRTASVDALHAALRAQQLSTLLFPTNAITDAPKVIAELDAVFPTAPGRFLFGPMAKIGWGTPTVLTATLAIIVELPEPIRIILLARLEARLPSPSSPLVRINMDALGVLDFDKRELSLDATLFDSRLVGFSLSGAMALRATWGAQREFVLAVGGVHPAFTPPPGFPALQRIAINMPSGIVSKLRLSAYLAITSNTVQLGADLDVAISVSGFGLAGHLGFDALLQLVPFHFDADISGSVTITAWGNDLASVALDASLSGPAPWSIAGHFKISAVFFDVHVPFSHSWGDEAPAQAIAPVDVGALLAATLADPRSWGAPLDVPASVSLRRIDDPSSVVAHPLARIEVHERVVPLGLDITRFGSATPQGARRFTITDFRIAGKFVARDAVQDDFAPAQFLELSDDEKLARPSFEPHDAGVKTGALAATAGAATRKTTAYETFFIDDPGGAPRLDPVPPVRAGLAGLTASLALGAAGRMRRGSYASPGRGIQVAAPAFCVVDAATLRPAGVGPSGGVYSDVEAALNSELARAPHRRGQLLIVGQHEIGAA